MKIEEFENIEAVVIGAGPAGLSCLKELLRLKKKTLLILPNDVLNSNVGGMAKNWHSQCAVFESYDFQALESFNSWPISSTEYLAYIKEVEEILEVEMNQNNFEKEIFSIESENVRIHSINSVIGSHRTWESIFKSELESPYLQIKHGEVTRILQDGNARGVILRNQTTLVFGAQVNFYIAAGCVQNTKILHASNFTNSRILGSYLADHPMFENHLIKKGSKKHFYPIFTLNKEKKLKQLVKQKYRVMSDKNVIGIFEIRHYYTKRSLNNKTKSISITEIFKQVVNKIFYRITYRIVFRPLESKLWIQLAQELNEESKINFKGSDVEIDWKLNKQDLENYNKIVFSASALLSSWGFEVKSLNKIESIRDLQETMQPAYHLSGTTRMHKNIGFGITDMNGKVHGFSNLYICGASVFTTPGWANPTLSIMALSLRTVRLSAQNSI